MIPFKLLGSDKLKERKDKEGVTDYKIEGVFPSSFFLLIIGKPGTGKTTLIEEMLLNDNIFNSRFNHVIVFSPNLFPNLNLELEKNYFKSFELDVLFNILNNFSEKSQNSEYKNILIIFDDMIADIKKKQYEPLLLKLFFNRRHIIKNGCISILMTTQKFIITPPNIRPCINSLILFQLNSSEYTSLKNDVCSWIDFKIVTNSLNNSYDFVYINLTNGNLYKNLQNKLN